MNLGMELQQRQQLIMTPQLQQALRLLQLSTQEFRQELDDALANNPFLEEAESSSADQAAFVKDAHSTDTRLDITLPSPPPDAHEGPGIWEERGNRHSDSTSDWTDWAAAPSSLHDDLHQQLRSWPSSDRDRILAHLLVDELSEAGYLETPLEALLEIFPDEIHVTLQDLSSALGIVQQLEPCGVGARNLRECLSLQLAELTPETTGLGLARQIVSAHFDLLAKRQFPKLLRLLECTDTELNVARSLIRSLEPRPGNRYSNTGVRYILPDVLVLPAGKRWIARLNPAVHIPIGLNQRYADLTTARRDNTATPPLLQEARWLIRSISQRFETIDVVANAIVTRQKNFFTYGDAAMRPMALKDIAADVGLHESTICRVTNGKYMATPQGLFEFKHFFSRDLGTRRGGSCSGHAIRAVIRELIAAENTAQPLSDVQLCKLLAEQGFKLVRRTVSKYRAQMCIPSVELRHLELRSQAL